MLRVVVINDFIRDDVANKLLKEEDVSSDTTTNWKAFKVGIAAL
jgi:hypothetical protein